MKYKVGDIVIIKSEFLFTYGIGIVTKVDKEDSLLPYLVQEDSDEKISWWLNENEVYPGTLAGKILYGDKK